MNATDLKPYTPPTITVIEMRNESPLLCGSDSDNNWWKDEQPEADDWWQGGW